jgi:predicted transcriptional regulator
MTRELRYDQPLMVKLEPDLKRRLKIEAAASGTDMSKMVREMIANELDRRERERRRDEGRGKRLVEHMRARATGKMTTDEIMALTRGE